MSKSTGTAIAFGILGIGWAADHAHLKGQLEGARQKFNQSESQNLELRLRRRDDPAPLADP